jgi:hypothetical protein
MTPDPAPHSVRHRTRRRPRREEDPPLLEEGGSTASGGGRPPRREKGGRCAGEEGGSAVSGEDTLEGRIRHHHSSPRGEERAEGEEGAAQLYRRRGRGGRWHAICWRRGEEGGGVERREVQLRREAVAHLGRKAGGLGFWVGGGGLYTAMEVGWRWAGGVSWWAKVSLPRARHLGSWQRDNFNQINY